MSEFLGPNNDPNELKPLTELLGQVVGRTFLAFSDSVHTTRQGEVEFNILDLTLADGRQMRMATENGTPSVAIHSAQDPVLLELALCRTERGGVLRKFGSTISSQVQTVATTVEATLNDVNYLERVIIQSKPTNLH